MIPFHFHPEAEVELSETALFYESRVRGLGLQFVEEVERRVATVRQHPAAGSILSNKTRIVLLQRFPYSVIYHFNGGDIRILAIAAQARRPGYWRHRVVNDRDDG